MRIIRSLPVYAVMLTVLAARPGRSQQLFDDVPPSAPYFTAVNTMKNSGITNGCNLDPPQFCPEPTISGDNGYLYRYQMAIFVIRAWSIKRWGSPEAFRTYAPPSTTPHFADAQPYAYEVPVDDPWTTSYVSPNAAIAFPYIQKMWELGFTTGCWAGSDPSTRRYCPGDLPAPWRGYHRATNYQIAVFSVRARLAADSACPYNCGYTWQTFSYTDTPWFNDVPASNAYFAYIQKAVDYSAVLPFRGMLGCSSYMYCPDADSYRGQMANFVVGIILGQSVLAGGRLDLVSGSKQPPGASVEDTVTWTLYGFGGCAGGTVTISGKSYPVARLNGNEVRSWAETRVSGSLSPVGLVAVQADLFRDGVKIGTHNKVADRPGAPAITPFFTATLQHWGPGTYQVVSTHSISSVVCPVSSTAAASGTTSSTPLTVERPARPDYSTMAGSGPVTFLGPDILASGSYHATTILNAGAANGAPETPQWLFKAGSEFGRLNTTSGFAVLFTATQKSRSCLSYDVVLVNSYNGFESEPFFMFIDAPHNTIAVPDETGGVWDYTYPFYDGYETRINYKTETLCALRPPMANYEVNESLAGWSNDYPEANWGVGPAKGGPVPDNQWFDKINFISAWCTSQPCKPTPKNPGEEYIRVHNTPQTWYVGSQISGQGAPIQTNTLYRYTDQATHEAITTPVQ